MKPYTLSTRSEIVHAYHFLPPLREISMSETWLEPNRRALKLGMVPLLLLLGLGGLLAGTNWSAVLYWLQWVGVALSALTFIGILLMVRELRRPRLAYHDGRILFFLKAGRPIAVPADVIEAFFIGQGPAHLPVRIRQHETSLNLVARLSRRAPDWAERNVKPALGHWSDGYVTIRGTWCEPLTVDVVRRLNRRLKEIQETGDERSVASAMEGRGDCKSEPC